MSFFFFGTKKKKKNLEQAVILIEHKSCLLEAAVKFSNHGNFFPGFS